MNIELVFFKKIKVLKLKINKKYCKILKFKFEMKSIEKLESNKYMIYLLKNIDKLKPNIKKFNLNLSVGTQDMIITIFLIPVLSTILSIFVLKYFSENKTTNFYMNINPNFINVNNFSLKFKAKIKLSTIRIFLLLESMYR